MNDFTDHRYQSKPQYGTKAKTHLRYERDGEHHQHADTLVKLLSSILIGPEAQTRLQRLINDKVPTVVDIHHDDDEFLLLARLSRTPLYFMIFKFAYYFMASIRSLPHISFQPKLPLVYRTELIYISKFANRKRAELSREDATREVPIGTSFFF